MKKHIIVCYLIAGIGWTVGIFIIIYSNFVTGFKFKYPILWGSSVITMISIIRLSHLKKIKNKWGDYYVCMILFIMFVMSLFDMNSA